MNKLEKINSLIGKYMALIVLIVAFISLFYPSSALWIKTSWINYFLMIIMFGMGLTLKLKDFVLVFSQPKEIITGCIAQYTIMPALAFVLCYLFHLDTALTAGVVLVGTCPGGTASNVITFLSKGDTAFSVCMTSVNTLLAPVLTPLITYLILNTSVAIDIKTLFLGIINIVIIPIISGVIVNKFFGNFTQKFVSILPSVSVFAICMVLACVVSHNAQQIYRSGLIILAVIILHNLLGYVSGFIIGKALKMNAAKIKAISIEIGMQNSGLASGLANSTFPALLGASVPGAIFSVWHNISGAILAAIYKNWKDSDN